MTTALAQGFNEAPISQLCNDRKYYFHPEHPGGTFQFGTWISRGKCVRSQPGYVACQAILRGVLQNLDYLQATEFSASASTLTLLLTIGALSGTPTSDTWTLFTIVPFGGSLATLLSSGSAILPSRIADFHSSLARQSTETFTIGDTREYHGDSDATTSDKLRSNLAEKIQKRMEQQQSNQLPILNLTLGLVGMILLLAGVQAGIAIIEVGSVYYATAATILSNWARLPFQKQWKFYVSDIPYNVEVAGGSNILEPGATSTPSPHPDNEAAAGKSVGTTLKQLATVRPGSVRIQGSPIHTKPRNTVLVLISVTRESNSYRASWWAGLEVFSQAVSVTVFVLATSVFASVTILAMPMAQMILLLFLGAGIGSRVIVDGLVSTVARTKPLIHVIAGNEIEAHNVIMELFAMQKLQWTSEFQIEFEGHILVDCQRVGRRSRWWRRLFGLMARTYNLRESKDRYEEVKD